MNMRTSIRTTAMIALIAGGLLALSPGRALASHVSCGDTITTDTRLDSDLIDCPLWGIRIGADHITLDLAGHTIAQAPNLVEPRGGIVDRVGHDGVTIKNGTVRGFDTGVFLINATNNRLRRLTVTGNDYDGIDLLQSEGNQVENNRVYGNGLETEQQRDPHVSVKPQRDPRQLPHGQRRCRAGSPRVQRQPGGTERDRPKHGGDRHRPLRPQPVRPQPRVRQRRSRSSSPAAITRSPTTTSSAQSAAPKAAGSGSRSKADRATSSRATRSVGRSEMASGSPHSSPSCPTIDTIVRDNHVSNAAVDAFSVATEGEGTVGQTLFRRNTAIASGDDGFDVRSPASKLTSNLAVRNGDLGIDAVAGVVDGGHNRAFANGNPLQCIHIAC